MAIYPRRFAALVVATSVAAIAGPVSASTAAVVPTPTAPTFPVSASALPWPGPAAIGIGGQQIGQAGCVGTNRPSVGGNAGSASAQTCGVVLSFVGPQIGQIANVMGPTIIGSVVQAPIQTSAAPITNP